MKLSKIYQDYKKSVNQYFKEFISELDKIEEDYIEEEPSYKLKHLNFHDLKGNWTPESNIIRYQIKAIKDLVLYHYQKNDIEQLHSDIKTILLNNQVKSIREEKGVLYRGNYFIKIKSEIIDKLSNIIN